MSDPIQVAIDTIEYYLKHPPKNHSELFVQGMNDAYYRTLSILRTLPSAQPEHLCVVTNKISKAYEKAINTPCIHNPMAWALYQVWKEYDR